MASAILHSLGMAPAGIVHCIPLETMWLPSAAPLRGSRVRVYFSTVIDAVGHISEDFLHVVVVGNAMVMDSDMAEACF